MHADTTPTGPHGVMAEFDTAEALIAAAEKVREHGYTKTDAYSPFPVDGLNEAMGIGPTKLPILVLLGALAGGLSGYAMQYWMEVIDYPKNIGGRPYLSWPSFVPAIFELTILLGSFTTVIAMLALNGLPRPYHPVFNVPSFRRASRDGFFLCIESEDPKFDLAGTTAFLETLNPSGVFEVER
ncbi:MAG TPA: DUF3341 domain-containing protein [Blastocatellia bacterium]|nr:DUF3341 domain-containing protein [Blastocatellia bacterium]